MTLPPTYFLAKINTPEQASKAVLPKRTFCDDRNVLICTVQYGSHWSHVLTERLKCGSCN